MNTCPTQSNSMNPKDKRQEQDTSNPNETMFLWVNDIIALDQEARNNVYKESLKNKKSEKYE